MKKYQLTYWRRQPNRQVNTDPTSRAGDWKTLSYYLDRKNHSFSAKNDQSAKRYCDKILSKQKNLAKFHLSVIIMTGGAVKIVKKDKPKKDKPNKPGQVGKRALNEIIEQRFRLYDWLGRPRPAAPLASSAAQQ